VTDIYHITHVDNLASIVRAGCLVADSERIARGMDVRIVGHRHIKDRRMRRTVDVAAGGVLGDYVPFYFCPRSVMLHSIWRGLVEGYSGGQGEVVHLVSAIEEATDLGRPWAFTNLHAELWEAEYFDDLTELDQLRWEIIRSDSWGGDERRMYKQAEFLIHRDFPWTAVRRIGVCSEEIMAKVEAVAGGGAHRPLASVEPRWYY